MPNDIAKLLARTLLTRNARRFLRTAVHCRSLATAHRLHTRTRSLREITLPSIEGTLRLRTGTSDAELLRIIANGYDFPEYRVPISLKPSVILDLGANIGAASILFARKFPSARIYAFEPLPENFELLAHNVASFANVTAIPFGLGSRTEQRSYYRSIVPTNLAGGGFYSDGGRAFAQRGPRAGVVSLNVLGAADAMERYGIDRTDLIKIDTEGAEYDILTNLPQRLLDTVQVIVGELHGVKNAETLAFLEEAGFGVTSTFPHGVVGWFQAKRAALHRMSTRVDAMSAAAAYEPALP